MKFLGLMTVILISGNVMAQECVNLSGKYRMKIKEACTERSIKSLGEDKSSNRIRLADRLNAYSEQAFIDLTSEYVEFEVQQFGCEKLQITNRNEQYAGTDIEWAKFNYNIKDGQILKHGFKFKKVEGTFSGNGAGDAGALGIYREKNKFKIVKDKLNDKQIHLSSSMKAWGALFFLIPYFESEAFLDCTMDKVE